MVFQPKKDKFTVLLIEIAQNIKQSADYFAAYNIKNVSDLKVYSEKMKEFEHTGDAKVHIMTRELNNAFITPIDREDILELTFRMDDVLDGLEHSAALFEMYSIIHADEYMIKFFNAIKQCGAEIEIAVNTLSTKRLAQIRNNAIKIKDLESVCDGIQRQSIKNLFTVEKDPIRIIQYKEIYENLEEIADCCQAVANTLETIIMKNA